MSDIVERLEDARRFDGDYAYLQGEAAREIKILRAQLAETLKRETATTARYDARIAELKAENARLRAALATSKGACVYCSLPAEEWQRCKRGFPGCARADDAMGCPEMGASLEANDLREENTRLREALERAELVFRRYAEMHEAKGTPEGLEKAEANRSEAERILEALKETK